MDGYVTIGTEIDTKGFDKQIEEIEYELKQLDYELSHKKELKLDNRTIKEYEAKAQKLGNQLEKLKQKQEELNKTGFSNVSSSLNGIGNSMEGIIKKVTRWGLAIFSVRSAYMFIRQSVSTLSQYDDELATNIEYIRFALATAIKPIIEWIIKAVSTIIKLVGSLIYSIFHVNIFASASADAFTKAKNSLGGANKEAKKLQKTLAGFDEMNILQENGSVLAGGGGGGVPSIDFGDIADNSTIKKLKNFWDEIFNFWEKDWKDIFNNLGGKWGSFIQGLILTVKGFWDVLKGIGEVIIGLVQTIVGIVTGNFDLVKKGFSTMIDGIKNIFTGAIEIITGVLLTVFGFVKGIFLEIVDFIDKNVIQPILKFFDGLWNGIKTSVGFVVDKISELFNGLKDIVEAPFNALIDGVKTIWNSISKPLKEFVNNVASVLSKLNPFKWIVDLFSGGGSWSEVKRFANDMEKKSKSKGGIRAKGGIFYPNKLPKLAVGGIINQPGRGVPYHGAIIGERGAEAVVPLTDSQQMALLGETIGKYITVNAQMNNYMNGRLISRELQRVQNDSDFAYNR